MTAEGAVDPSVVVGASRLAKIYGKSRGWAQHLLAQWLEEQGDGGQKRVFVMGKRKAIYTTLAVLQREMPPARDQVLVRKVAELNRDVDTLAQRVDRLTSELALLRRSLGGAAVRLG